MQLGIVVHTWDPTTGTLRQDSEFGVSLGYMVRSYDNREVKAMHLYCRSVGMPVRNTQPCPPGEVCAFLGIPRKPCT